MNSIFNKFRSHVFLLSFEEYRTSYFGIFSKVALFLEVTLGLVVVYFTSQVFGTQMGHSYLEMKEGYFYFIVLGELCALFPASLVSGFTTGILQAKANGVLESYTVLPISRWKVFFLVGYGSLFRAFVHLVLLLASASLLFQFRIPLGQALLILLAVLLSLPVFSAIGIVLASVALGTGRGGGGVIFASRALMILSGVYFPLDVLPTQLERLVRFSSPLHVLMQFCRNPSWQIFPSFLLGTVLWSIFFISISAFAVPWAFLKTAERGSCEVYPQSSPRA